MSDCPPSLRIECYPCKAPIGVPCAGDGSVCASRVTRALLGVGNAPPDSLEAALEDFCRRAPKDGN